MLNKTHLNIIPTLQPKINREFSVKLLEAQGIIARNITLYREKSAVTFSGGRDSLVVLHMVWTIYPEIKVVFNNTGVEHPYTIKFIRELVKKWGLNYYPTPSAKTFWQCVEEYGYPIAKRQVKDGIKIKHSAQCCYWLKEKPMRLFIQDKKLNCVFGGNKAVDNYNRMWHAQTSGQCFFKKSLNIQQVYPVVFWTDEDIKQYIELHNLPTNPIYEVVERSGCLPCTAHKYWEKQIASLNPKLYAYIKLMKDKQYVMSGVHDV